MPKHKKRFPKKEVAIIAAISEDGVYSINGGLPWNIPGELARFKELTFGSTVVMGRKTYESLPLRDEKTGDRSLPGRQNIVISNMRGYVAVGCLVVSSLEDALLMASHEKVFCIGGARLWMEALPVASSAYISVVKKHYDGIDEALRLESFVLLGYNHPRFVVGSVESKVLPQKDGTETKVIFYKWVAQ
jgi:dihydrofolate reductase